MGGRLVVVGSLSWEQRFGRQYQYIQRIVAVYETQPENFERLMELMQDMQECGQVSASDHLSLPTIPLCPPQWPCLPTHCPAIHATGSSFTHDWPCHPACLRCDSIARSPRQTL